MGALALLRVCGLRGCAVQMLDVGCRGQSDVRAATAAGALYGGKGWRLGRAVGERVAGCALSVVSSGKG